VLHVSPFSNEILKMIAVSPAGSGVENSSAREIKQQGNQTVEKTTGSKCNYSNADARSSIGFLSRLESTAVDR
jgi:hypothetical protein